MQPQKKLQDFSVNDLKVMAYDQMAAIEQAQYNLKAINQEISRQQNQPNGTGNNNDTTRSGANQEGEAPEATESTTG